MKVASLLAFIGLLPGAFTIRDDLEERMPLEKDSVYPSAFVELRDAAKTKGLVASKAAGRTTSQTVRTGKGRHHEHGTSEGHHHHGHKKHHHGRRHHEDDDERSEEEEVSTKDSDRRSEEEDSEDERAPRHRHRKQSEDDEVDEEQPREDDEEDEPRKHSSRHSKVKEEKSPTSPSKADHAPESKTKKKTKATTTTPSKEAAVDHSPPLAAPLDVFGAIRACAAWVFPIFGWALVIILVALIALRIKWPELSNMGVRYMAKRMSLPSKKRKEGEEKQEKHDEPKQNEESNDQATATPAPAVSD